MSRSGVSVLAWLCIGQLKTDKLIRFRDYQGYNSGYGGGYGQGGYGNPVRGGGGYGPPAMGYGGADVCRHYRTQFA